MNLLRKAQWSAYSSCGLFSASQAFLFVMYPVLADKLGLSLSEVILCFTIGSFLFIWGGPYWAMRSDREGRSSVLRITQSGVFVSLVVLLLLLSPIAWNAKLSFAVLLVSRILYGLLASGLVPVSQALVLDHGNGRERTKAAATHSMFLNLGRFLGPVIGLGLAAISPTLLVACFALLSLGLMIWQPKLPKVEGKTAERRRPQLRDIWPDSREMQGVVLIALFTTIFLGILQSSLGAYLKADFQMSAEQASHSMAKLLIAAALTTVAVQFGMRSKLKNPWQGSIPIGALCQAVGTLSLLVVPRFEYLYASVILISFGIALITPSYTSAMSYFSADRQGVGAASLSLAHTLGYSLGGGLSALGLTVSGNAPFWTAFGVSLLIFTTIPAIYSGRHHLQLLEESNRVSPQS